MLVTVHPGRNLQSGRICKEVKIGNPGEYFCHWAFITHQKQHGGKRDQHRVHTEWQLPLSGVHSIIMEKSGQPGERGVVYAHPLSLYLTSLTKLWCTLQLRGQIPSPFFYSTPICTLWGSHILVLCSGCVTICGVQY
jgi:hypothetical protein